MTNDGMIDHAGVLDGDLVREEDITNEEMVFVLGEGLVSKEPVVALPPLKATEVMQKAHIPEKQDASLRQLQEQFRGLLQSLDIETARLREKSQQNPAYAEIYCANKVLESRLRTSGDTFFCDPTPVGLIEFKASVKRAVEIAAKEFNHHRIPYNISVWNEIHPILKGILGVLSALAVIPALIVQSQSKQGYYATFFYDSSTESPIRPQGTHASVDHFSKR
ncbi:MAG: hypothetical protein NTW94_07380 [Legionellales bacterium]|nr:hypothetical protein [Legionellales bacterium]